jgi:hypothetical protein
MFRPFGTVVACSIIHQRALSESLDSTSA